jgi:signal transduction histidine kinase
MSVEQGAPSEGPGWQPRLVEGAGADAEQDPRVRAVMEVLGGRSVPEVALRWAVDVAVVHRWVLAFVDAGTAQVTNRPTADSAQQRDRFLAAFAHELRTPLTTAQGWVAMLEEGDVPPAALERTVAKLSDSLERLAERVLDVELLAAASLGLLQLKPGRIAVGDLVVGIDGLEEVGGLGPGTEIVVDPGLFRRAVRDLWTAGLSEPRPRSLRLEVEYVEPWLEVRVVREADPIDIEVLQALFEPFDLNDDRTGVTIGLYLARALVVAHGGTLGADQDDHHTVLWIRIPHQA